MISIFNDILSIPVVKLIVLIFFFLFIYGMISKIFIFLGVRSEIANTYLMWISVLLILITFLPQRESTLFDF